MAYVTEHLDFLEFVVFSYLEVLLGQMKKICIFVQNSHLNQCYLYRSSK